MIFAKLILFLLFGLIAIVPTLLFLLHQPGRRYNKSSSAFERFQMGLVQGLKGKNAPSQSEGLIPRILLVLLCIWIFTVEGNAGYLLLAATPILAQVRFLLRLPQGLAGDEREFTTSIRITAASFICALMVPLTLSIVWSRPIDMLTLLATIFTVSEVLHLIFSWLFNRVETLDPETSN